MVDEQTLKEAVRRITAVAQPSRIILFGSQARQQTNAADLDLLVIQPEIADRYAEMLRLHEALGNLGLGIDLLIYSEAEFERRSRVPGTVPYWARKEGKSLYAAAS
ncbi:MAG TPA: nucleotidyltransferase domain-containing protein [Anaerolineales bacterium]|nr:nucleotidyltransferase domain-containing protein [Anaerolineales bacterium]